MPITTKIYNQKAEAVGELELPKKIFGLNINEQLVHQAVVAQLANQRQVLAHTKTRSEVRGGGKKPWSQKGTGRARAGSSRSPIWIGGGVVFGPRKNRNFKVKINKKMKQQALLMVFTDRINNNNLIVLDNLKLDNYKTKDFNQIITNFEKNILNNDIADKENKKKNKRSVLIVLEKKDKMTRNSGRNIAGVDIIYLDNLNIADALKRKNLILTQETIKKLEERIK